MIQGKVSERTLYRGKQITSIKPTCICGRLGRRTRRLPALPPGAARPTALLLRLRHRLSSSSRRALEMKEYMDTNFPYVLVCQYIISLRQWKDSRAVGKYPPSRCCCSEPPGKRKRSSDFTNLSNTCHSVTHLSPRQWFPAFLRRLARSFDDFFQMSLKRNLGSLIMFLVVHLEEFSRSLY